MAMNNKDKRIVVLSAGGTAGHVFPATALLKELETRGLEVKIITDSRGRKWADILNISTNFQIQASGFFGKGVFSKVVGLLKTLFGMFQTIFIIWRLKPALVVGFGGYASIPAILVASFRSIPTVIHEQNSVLGRANRFVAKRVDKIATSYQNVRFLEKTIENKVVFTGMPVRSLVEELRSTEYPVILDSSSLKILIFGGSQGANIFSRVLPQSLDRLDVRLRSRIEVIHQCRVEDTDTLVSNYRELGIKFEVSEFFSDLPEKIAQSNLVITRAGSSTLAEITIIGRPAVIVPYPFAVDDHQTTNAKEFESAGGGWLFSNTSFTPKLCAGLLKEVLFDPVILEKKAMSSKNMGQVGAVSRLADLSLGLISKSSPVESGVAK